MVHVDQAGLRLRRVVHPRGRLDAEAEELLIEKPPPRTPNLPPPPAARAPRPRRCRRCDCARGPIHIAPRGDAARTARRTAGGPGATPATSAARSIVHSAARARSSSAPRRVLGEERSSAQPVSKGSGATPAPAAGRCRASARCADPPGARAGGARIDDHELRAGGVLP